MKKDKKEFDGFSVNLILDDENEWVAHFVELPGISAIGETAEEALTELKSAWEGMKESYRKHKEPIPIAPTQKEYSGHLSIRIDKRVHRELAIEAAQAGISLNALIAEKLACCAQSIRG